MLLCFLEKKTFILISDHAYLKCSHQLQRYRIIFKQNEYNYNSACFIWSSRTP